MYIDIDDGCVDWNMRDNLKQRDADNMFDEIVD